MGMLKHLARLVAGKGHLCLAAHEGDTEKCRKLLALGSDPNEVDGWGVPPLFIAVAKESDVACIQVLLEAGANPNWREEGDWKGQTALHRAAVKGLTEVCMALLEHGADPSIRTTEGGWTAYDLAMLNGSVTCAVVIESFSGSKTAEAGAKST